METRRKIKEQEDHCVDMAVEHLVDPSQAVEIIQELQRKDAVGELKFHRNFDELSESALIDILDCRSTPKQISMRIFVEFSVKNVTFSAKRKQISLF